ncbi:family 43 glycosylhydrolase [Niabella insulamsoli]|uniref:family 43 glycosylhydrolase n=1 Tax=Niabella insulamsoli TaxID=3144874 RepID=UPI0031FD9D26
MKYISLFACSLAFNCTVANAQLNADQVRSSLQAHQSAVLVKDDIWIRDPYITLAPDGFYYLTGTTQMPTKQSAESAKYNVGLGDSSQVGWQVRVWKSPDLVDWKYAGAPFSLENGYWALQNQDAFKNTPKRKWHLWAPELHFINNKWVMVHTTPGPVKQGSNLAVSRTAELKGPFDFPLKDLSKGLHDPSLFKDTDGKVYIIWGNTQIAELKPDMSGFVAAPQPIHPSTLRIMGDGSKKEGIGHEGCTILKIGGKYVLFGTGWSTNKGRKGSYNLYYTVADNIKGPYGPRQFVGRFLGHGTPFQDKQGRWWCTAFYNANVPPLSTEGIQTKDLRDNAYTINKQGVTLVPLDVKVTPDGKIEIKALDPDYAKPGPDEVQKF